MKKIISTLFSLVFAFGLFAQQAPPQGINYQAVVYSSTGNQQVGVNSAGQQLLNTHPVKVTFSITLGNQGPEVYKEEHDGINTDQYGMVSVIIGQGTQISSGAFNQIDWSSGDMYLGVDIYVYEQLPVQSFTVSSYQKLWSVPYALYADEANSADYATNSGHADSSDYADMAGNGITGVSDNGDGTLTFTYYDGSSFTTSILSGLTGSQGPAGANGISAYDLWLTQGNTGTVADFLNGLIGTNGSQGQQGDPGPQGPQGPAGNGFQNGNVLGQVMYWDGSTWILLNPGNQAQILTICNGVPTWTTGGVCPGTGTTTTLNCGSATNTGILQSGVAASGVNSSVPYTGGNGGNHNGQTVGSTGVTGLTATLAPGNFATGAGSLTYTITGTPSTSGSASFALNIGGQTCTLIRTVNLPAGTITTLSCGTATNTGILTAGTVASGVSSSVPYTGGNGGTHNGQLVTSTGVTGLTATLAAGTFANGAGNLTYTITGTPGSGGTASFALNIGGKTCTLTRTVNLPVGTITTLSCGTATNIGTLTAGTIASGVSSSVPYTGGNGGTQNGQTVTSTGVTGLTATLTAGNFAVGTGSLTYTITGTPSVGGTASFTLNIGGQTCTLTRTVNHAYPAGTVHCNGIPTVVNEVTNSTTGKTWMDRNLGATQVATSSTDGAAYGDLYQWGRRADGHQCRNSTTTTILSSTDQPGHGNFIVGSNDWRSPQNVNLWQGVNGINNPCPIGFRLPTESEIDLERASWSSNDFIGAFNSQLKLSMGGDRYASNGGINLIGQIGIYSTSTISTTQSRYLYFFSGAAYMNSYNRGHGLSVRCIKN